MGGERQLISAVEALVQRLSAALIALTSPEIQAVATELLQLVTGTARPTSPASTEEAPNNAAPGPARSSFWK